jgi:predicted ThiF/HesA family dinucleotide-utilizing enzyme
MVANCIQNAERNRPLGRHTSGCECNVRIDLKETHREGVEWINLAQDRDELQGLMGHGNDISEDGAEFIDRLSNYQPHVASNLD